MMFCIEQTGEMPKGINEMSAERDTQMKRLALGFAATLMFLTVTGAAPENQTLTGQIMDGKCASAGSHEEMLKSHKDLNTAEDCTLACMKNGSKLVLFEKLRKTVYQLDDQKKPAQFAGEYVTVTGTLDDSNETIHVVSIKLSPIESPSPASDQSH
jgi:hypothetical protein